MEKRRLFVGNLPHEIDQDVLKNRFSKYGNVFSVELKHKYAGSNEHDILSTFAFVDLQASQETITTCIKKLSRKKWLGKEVTVQFAKESILSRLENERKINKKVDLKESTDEDLFKISYDTKSECSKLLQSKNKKWFVPQENTKTNSMLKRTNDGTVYDSSAFLSKLENFSDVWKDCDELNDGKITKFDDSDFTVVPLKISESDKTDVSLSHLNSHPSISDKQSGVSNNSYSRHFVESSEQKRLKSVDPSISDKQSGVSNNSYSRHFIESSEQKRLKSVEEMKKVIDQRKLMIKKALSSVDSSNQNKKIFFNDHDDNNCEKHLYHGSTSKKNVQFGSGNQLFNDDSADEDEVHSFVIKQQFEGEKGKKLFQLQSKFGNDSRFFMDERFYESNQENNSEENHKEGSGEHNDKENEGTNSVDDEVTKQLQILQSIVGDKDLGRKRKKQKCDKPVTSAVGVRFDPTIPEHEKFIRKPDEDNDNLDNAKDKVKRNIKNHKNNDDEELDDEQKNLEAGNKSYVPQVSKETFYEVADELKETLKSTEKSCFSFSDLFNSSSDKNIKKSKDSNNSGNTPSMKNTSFINLEDNRFGGDFSSKSEKLETSNDNKDKESRKRSGSLWHENFFYQRGDPRLDEAFNFFSRESFEVEDDFEKKRKELKKIIKKKIMNKARSDRPFKKKIGSRSSFRKKFKRKR